MPAPDPKVKTAAEIEELRWKIAEVSPDIATAIAELLWQTVLLERARCANIARAVYERAGGRGGEPRDQGRPVDGQNYWKRVAAEEIADAIEAGP